jgi:ADP-ribosylglycohydrolase
MITSNYTDKAVRNTLNQSIKYVGDGYHNDDTTTAYYFWFAQFNDEEKAVVQTVKATFRELQ